MKSIFKILIISLFSLLLLNKSLAKERVEKIEGDLEWNVSCLKDSSLPIDERWEAEEALVRIGEPAVSRLIEIIENVKEKQAVNLAIVALSEIGDSRAVPALGKVLLKNEDLNLQVTAAIALGEFHDGIAGDYLLKRIIESKTLQDNYSIIRYDAKAFINSSVLKSNYFITGNIGDGWQDVGNQLETVTGDAYLEFSFVGTGCDMLAYHDISGAMLEISIDNEEAFYYKQFSELNKHGVKRINLCKNLAYGEHIIKIQKTPEGRYMRVNAFEVYIKEVTMNRELLSLKNASDDMFVRGAVIVSLGKLRYKKALQILIEKLTEDITYIRRLSAWALGEIGGKKIMPVFEELLKREQDPKVKATLDKVLSRFTAKDKDSNGN